MKKNPLERPIRPPALFSVRFPNILLACTRSFSLKSKFSYFDHWYRLKTQENEGLSGVFSECKIQSEILNTSCSKYTSALSLFMLNSTQILAQSQL